MLSYDLQFNSVLASLLDRISQLGRDNYNEKVFNNLHRLVHIGILMLRCLTLTFRLDFNGFYTSAVPDQAGHNTE